MSEEEIEIRVNLPSNKKEDEPEEVEKVKLEAVTKSVKKERPGVKHAFRNIFSGGDLLTIFGFVASSVLLPGIKSMLLDSITKGAEQALYGESQAKYQQTSRAGGPINYSMISTANRGSSRAISPSSSSQSSRHTENWIIPTRGEAELVVDNLKQQIAEYGQATVADYYELIGRTGSYTDNNWGWLDLQHVRIDRVHGGYVINLPTARPL